MILQYILLSFELSTDRINASRRLLRTVDLSSSLKAGLSFFARQNWTIEFFKSVTANWRMLISRSLRSAIIMSFNGYPGSIALWARKLYPRWISSWLWAFTHSVIAWRMFEMSICDIYSRERENQINISESTTFVEYGWESVIPRKTKLKLLAGYNYLREVNFFLFSQSSSNTIRLIDSFSDCIWLIWEMLPPTHSEIHCI